MDGLVKLHKGKEPVFHLDLAQPIDVFFTERKTGIQATPGFAEKRLAQFAVNPGIKCGHGCLYCSSKATTRLHHSYKDVGRSPFGEGYSIIDPTTPDRVRADARRIQNRGMVELCTTVDAWADDAVRFDLGRRCLKAILKEDDWTVRILTKSAAVVKDFDIVEKYRDRVLFGMSVTGTPDKKKVVRVVEPNTTRVSKRIRVMKEAADRGFRTYGMLCPLLPGIADSPEQLDWLVSFYADIGAEEIFVEPVNARGNALVSCQEVLAHAGYQAEADAVSAIRTKTVWSSYVLALVKNTQRSVRKYYDIKKLRFLLYGHDLTPGDRAEIEADDAGVVWLGA